MSKITVNTTSKNSISINTKKQNIITVAGHGLTGAGSGVFTQLRRLTDVDATNLEDNNVLVYDEASDKFVVEKTPIINGGTF